MIVVDRLIIGGLRFVLEKIAAAVEQELDDEPLLREDLLAAQMRLELGEISEDEFRAIENELLPRLRALRPEVHGFEEGWRIAGADAAAELGHRDDS